MKVFTSFVFLCCFSWICYVVFSKNLLKNNIDFRAQATKPLGEPLLVGTEANYPPYEFKEHGQLTGFEIELIKEVSKRMGREEPQFKELAFDNLLMEAQMGHIQIIAAAMSPTEERKKRIGFSKVFLSQNPFVIISLTPYESLKDLEGKAVAVNTGFTAEIYVKAHHKGPIQSLSQPVDALNALKSKKVEAFIIVRDVAQTLLKKEKEAHLLKVKELDQGDTTAFGVSLKSQNLIPELNQAIESMEKDGSLKALKVKWHIQD